ncbi:MAG TPA: DpnII family type II restriction endonuclease [Anaerolineales bacterium]|nr:DpnII family type II restriction endonuclease [Anaerolineales bacterium]
MIQARKLSFQEAWESSVVFLVDEALEKEISAEVESLLKAAKDPRVSETAVITIENIAGFLAHEENGLEVVLKDIELSEEKFMRVISLLRKLGRIRGGFDSEWGISKIKNKIEDDEFARLVARLLVDGKRDRELQEYIPQYYLDTLNYREIKGSPETARRIRYKRLLIGTYGARKGHVVENRIRQKLETIKAAYGVGYEKGRSTFIDTDIDFAVPSLDDPWVIIMSTFQETTSSGQTTKAKDMFSAYERISRHNSRYKENRAFVNFVDGGGWLARKSDLERLVENCHYFANLRHIDILEDVVLKHVPKKYFKSKS